MTKITKPALLIIFIALFPSPPGVAQADENNGKNNGENNGIVFASTKPIHSIASFLMQGAGEPHLILNSTQSPHHQSLRPSIVRQLSKARLVFFIGGGFETSIERLRPSVLKNVPYLALIETEGLSPLPLRGGAHHKESDAMAEADGHDDHDDHDGHNDHDNHDNHDDHDNHDGHDDHDDHKPASFTPDPHLWLDPAALRPLARAMTAALEETDPGRKPLYRKNLKKFEKRLSQLEKEMKARLKPFKGKRIIVQHDGFAWFERAFGIENAGIVMTAGHHPPSARKLKRLFSQVKQEHISCAIAEPQFPPHTMERLTEATGIRLYNIDIQGHKIAPGPDHYFRMMADITNQFSLCLDGDG